MQEHSVTTLVQAALNGNVDSFGELYRRHYAAMVGIAYATLADHHLAEDAAQEAFAVACRDLRRLRTAEKFPHWLASICRKLAIRAVGKKLGHRLPENIVDDNGEPDPSGRNHDILQSVQRLPGSAREVIVLHYFSDLSHNQIAETLGISPQAVHGRLVRARKKIAEDLRQTGTIRRK